MKKKLSRALALSIAAITALSVLTGCGSNEGNKTDETTIGTTQEGKTQAYYEMLDSVQDSSELPDWTGKKLNIQFWYSAGTDFLPTRPKAENDVITPEIKRVTGVQIDPEKTFDNGGQSIDVKLGMLAAANDFPDVIFTSDTKALRQVVDAGKLYDLTEPMKQYCPNIMKLGDPNKFEGTRKVIGIQNEDGTYQDKYYFLPNQIEKNVIREIYADAYDPIKWARTFGIQPVTDAPRIWVRDDILKKLYPNAKTQDEIEALYMKNGSFTKEEIYDVPIKTKDDFVKFLYDIDALIKKENIKEGNQPVQVTYANQGSDNWALNSYLSSMLNGVPGDMYFSYFERSSKSLQYAFKSKYVKEDLKLFNNLVNDGILSKESLLDNSQIFNEKVNNGLYAVTYAWNKPDENVLKAGGKAYRYRLLWPEIPVNDSEKIGAYGFKNAPGNCAAIGIFKDSVKEEDLPQLLRWYDFLASDVGYKLLTWGPKTAGIWTEENGNRVFTDKELEACLVYNKDNKRDVYYGMGQVWPGTLGVISTNVFHPKYAYSVVSRKASEADAYFNPGTIAGQSFDDYQEGKILKSSVAVWDYQDLVPEVKKFWSSRDSFEKAFTQILAAKDDAQFEALYQQMIDLAEKNGLTTETLDKVNEIFKKQNEGYLDKIK